MRKSDGVGLTNLSRIERERYFRIQIEWERTRFLDVCEIQRFENEWGRKRFESVWERKRFENEWERDFNGGIER